MRIAKLMAAAAVLSLSAAPALAENPAQRLSVSKQVRASADKGSSQLFGASPLLFVIGAFAAIIVVYTAVDDDKPDSP